MNSFKIVVIVIIVVALAALIFFLLRRRTVLPPHLKPYFKNMADLEKSVKNQRLANEKRRKELKKPTNTEEAVEFLTLNDYNIPNPTYSEAIQMVDANLKDDPCEYGQVLGEIYAFSKIYNDPEKAYYYYYIGLSQNGYTVGFRDENNDPPHYCGPVGDFRNEAYVSELVDMLGFEKVKQIDIRAREWIKLNNFEVKDFEEEEVDPTSH